jgi:hypothetical protein
MSAAHPAESGTNIVALPGVGSDVAAAIAARRIDAVLSPIESLAVQISGVDFCRSATHAELTLE